MIVFIVEEREFSWIFDIGHKFPKHKSLIVFHGIVNYIWMPRFQADYQIATPYYDWF